jgi:hypothetical protein
MLLTLPNSPIWGAPIVWSGEFYPIHSRMLLNGTYDKPGFIGEVVVQFLLEKDAADRIIRVYKPFSFLDEQFYYHHIPEGAILNGASIPRFLWSVYGSPFIGDYRRAALVHDYRCAIRDLSSVYSHLVFYQAMKVDKVKPFRAKTMYNMVKIFGPRWK